MKRPCPHIAGFGGLCTAAAAAPAFAADSATSSFSFIASLLQMLAALAVVVGLILLAYYATNRWLPAFSAPRGISRYIRVLETRFLAPKQAVILVEVGGEYLLLGSSPAGVQLIKQIDMLEEIEVIEQPLATLWQSQAAERFRTVLADMLKSRQPGGTPAPNDEARQ